ncbi:carbon-nitrogen hydrolase family protein [Pseudomonas sp. RIT-PI-S]|uniref:carbon-nitrogen hydrolase family protein n=1 Tax=Pseudomonas sp. RIT-PI-S TaxID=3035295 RepID=UPI0021DA9C70|nr:carbon-nitrogen hydrolase family protein [Pseudomonas sp. RIT-PI-S]
MRIALYQGPAGPNLPVENLARLEAWAAEAARRGAELVVFPEMFLSGYNIGAQAAAAHAQAPDGPAPVHIAAIAQAHGLAIAYGYPEAGPDGAVYNAAQLVDRDGERLLDYRKAHLFGSLDRAMFSPGDGGFPVAELGGWKLGLLICYDVEFPEAVRELALAGADLIVVPTANMAGFEVVAQVTVRARAYENGCYLAYANYCGDEGELRYCGLSSLCGPAGEQIALNETEEGLLVVDLDPEHLAALRQATPYLTDRRSSLYRRSHE